MGYKINGNDLFTTYGIKIERVTGYLDMPKRKKPTAQNWDDEDGEEEFTDAGDIFFEPRNITLFCHIRTTTKFDFLTKLRAFKTVLKTAGLHTLGLPGMVIQTGGTASSGGPATMTDTGIGWVVNAYANYELYITGGTGSGQNQTIVSNTSDTITVDTNWDTEPDGTSTYEIRQKDISFYFKDGFTFNMLTHWDVSELVGRFVLPLREPDPVIP